MTIDVGASFRINAQVNGQQQLDKFNQSLREAGKSGEMSAAQIKNAMRTLPAQFTDIGTSLAGGQSPFLVLLQQGGQIRDQFGSVGAALRGIGSFITPASVAFGGLAVAVGSVAAAFLGGQKQSEEFSRALATTGNFAGVTADRIEEASKRIQASTALSAGSSRDLLTAIVQTGQFGPRNYEAVATAAAQVARVTGQGATEVLKQFNGLSSGAAKWAAEANKTYNFLDAAQYRYIRGLEEAGDKEGAQRVTAELLSKALKEREVQLGTLQTAWNGVKKAASGAWDAMLGIGRAQSSGDQLKQLEDRLGQMQKEAALEAGRGTGSRAAQKAVEDLQAQIAAIKETARLEQRQAEAQAANAAANQKAIEDQIKADEEAKRAREQAISQFASLKQGYQDQLLSVRELGVEETLRAQIQAGRYNQLSKPQQDELLGLAKKIDATKAAREAEEEAARAKKKADDKAARDAESEGKRLDNLRQQYIDLIDPVNKYVRKLEEIDQLQKAGKLDPTQALEARFRVQEQIDDLNKVKDTGKSAFEELKDAVQGWGRQATDTFVDFAFGAKTSFGDLAVSVLKDLARMLIQINVVKPLFDAFKGGGGGGGFGALLGGIGSIFGFASGGIMTSKGPLPLRTYADGGIVNRPQVRVAGEGSMNEAIIPLPDGRTVPVTLRGGGGGDVYNITVPVNMSGDGGAGGTDASQAGQLGKLIAAAVRGELINQRRPGGLLAA